jgi:predicted nucleotide-binding protein
MDSGSAFHMGYKMDSGTAHGLECRYGLLRDNFRIEGIYEEWKKGKVDAETTWNYYKFKLNYFNNQNNKSPSLKGIENIKIVEKILKELEDSTQSEAQKQMSENDRKVFIVHGRDEGVKAQVSNLIQKIKLQPIILHEQANEGKTIIEKFEKHADVKAAIVLFTGDDVGRYKKEDEYKKRPRQNVIFEAGYFMGKLGRRNTIILAEEGLDIQSDLQGYIYISLDERQKWHDDLTRELKAIGFDYDRQ